MYWERYNYGILTVFDGSVTNQSPSGALPTIMQGYQLWTPGWTPAAGGVPPGFFTGTTKLFAADTITGQFIALDMGEQMIPSYFKIWCPYVSVNTAQPTLYPTTFNRVPTGRPTGQPTGSPTQDGGISNAPHPNSPPADLTYNKMYKHCPGLFRLYGSSYYEETNNQRAPNMEHNWDILYDQTTARADYGPCVKGSVTDQLEYNTFQNGTCYTSGTINSARAYSKFAIVFVSSYGRLLDASATVEVTEIEFFGVPGRNSFEPSMSPTAYSGSAVPSPKPSALPGKPTATGTPSTVVSGTFEETFFFRTLHAGKKCMSAVTGLIIESVPLNLCLPSSPVPGSGSKKSLQAATTGATMFTCGLKGGTYTISKDSFVDAKCLSPSPSKSLVYAREQSCKKDPDSGYSRLTGCGRISDAVKATPQILVQGFSNAACTAGKQMRSTMLGVCMPVFQSGKGGVSGYKTLSFASQADGSITLVAKVYPVGSSKCTGTTFAPQTVSLSMSGSCLSDPLTPGMFYLNALHSTDLTVALEQARSWIVFVPTSVPTPAPSRPSAAPTQAPSRSPTLSPTASPTRSPTTAPTRLPT